MESQRVAVIIEDDTDIRDLLHAVLQQSGFVVYASPTGIDGVEAVRRHNPAVVTLDLGLPDIDGFEVIRQVRGFSDAYIVMLTARAEELDTLMGLEAGADDYVTKPFRPRELRARISAMLRRPRGGAATAPGTDAASPAPAGPAQGAPAVAGSAVLAEGVYRHNDLMLDAETRSVEVSGAPIPLTRTEFDLLEALLSGGRRVRTKPDLVRRLRGEEYDTGSYISDADERTIEVHVGNLRRKLGDDSRSPRWLETVRGVGYRLAPAQQS